MIDAYLECVIDYFWIAVPNVLPSNKVGYVSSFDNQK